MEAMLGHLAQSQCEASRGLPEWNDLPIQSQEAFRSVLGYLAPYGYDPDADVSKTDRLRGASWGKPSATEILKALMRLYESLYAENIVLQSLILTSSDAKLRRTWRSSVKAAAKDPEIQQKAHEKFVPLYERIDALTDETDVLELLSKIPLTGKVN
jgi:hypothetical protein